MTSPFEPFDLPQLEVQLQPADILLVAGTGWVSRQIIRATQSRGERPSRVSHVALVAGTGTLESAPLIEATHGAVREALIGEVYRDGSGLVVMRYRGLTPARAQRIVQRALLKRGERYGYVDILGHLIARLTGWGWPRKLVADRTPICSQLLDYAWRAELVSFGVVSPQPDDVDDAGRNYPGLWEWPVGMGLRRLPYRP